MWDGNVLCVALWAIWRKIVIHVRVVLVLAHGNGSPDHRDVR